MSLVYKGNHGKEFYFNELVVMEMVIASDEKRVGRLVQVRKGIGAFGMDLYIILLHDGSLMTFENVEIRKANDRAFEDAFYRSNGRTPPEVKDPDFYPQHEPNEEYNIMGKYPEKGFIIDTPKQPKSSQQSFGMVIVSEKTTK